MTSYQQNTRGLLIINSLDIVLVVKEFLAFLRCRKVNKDNSVVTQGLLGFGSGWGAERLHCPSNIYAV